MNVNLDAVGLLPEKHEKGGLFFNAINVLYT